MSAWAYCVECDAPIGRSDYTVENVTKQTYECLSCHTVNPVSNYSLSEFLQDLTDRVSALENK